MWYGFRLHVGANFLGLMAQLNGSITSIFSFKMCIKSHHLSHSWRMRKLENVLVILQTTEVLKVGSFFVSITTD